MADVMDATNQERAKRVAVERIVGFAKQFDEVHLNLACHAAFPLILTPDLLYQIWAHFVPEAPWSGVARVLLSRLCRQVGYEMYEMDIAVRNLLLRELKEQFGQEKLGELADFLMDYVAQRLTEDDADTQDLREAQEWTALAYTKPNQAARKLALALSEKVKQDDMGEVLRLASLVETLAEPLVKEGFLPLLVYSQGMASFIRGNLEIATKQFYEALEEDSQIWVAEVSLSIPQQILCKIEQAEEVKNPRISLFDTLKASMDGLLLVREAIQEKGWTELDPIWIKAAKTSQNALNRFWKELKIPKEEFIRICEAVELSWREVTKERSYFSTLRTKITDSELLKTSLRELGIKVKTNADVRAYDGTRVRADVVAVLEGDCDIGWLRNSDGTFDLIADLWGVAQKHSQTELLNSINQKYAINKTLAEIRQRGFVGKMECPRCASTQTDKYGYSQGKQNYICRNCGTQFTQY